MSATVKFWICLVPDLLLGKNIDKMKKYRYVATLIKYYIPGRRLKSSGALIDAEM